MKYYNLMPKDIYGINVKYSPPEEVGLEIEVEGNNLQQDFMSHWVSHKDASLRGAENAEYVLRKPYPRKDIPKVLKYLVDQLNHSKSVLLPSNRTSVHVHLNMSDRTMKQIYNLITLYVILEEPLVKYCGDERVGNLFCLRSSDAEYLLHILRNAVKADRYNDFVRDQLRYSSFNVCAIPKYGSLEFRTLRCPAKDGKLETNIIEEWVNVLTTMKDAAEGYDNPSEIVLDFSKLGPIAFAKKILGYWFKVLDQVDLDKKLYNGARLIQDVAFAVDWEVLDPKELSKRAEKAEKKPVKEKANNGWADGGGGMQWNKILVQRDPENGMGIHRVNDINVVFDHGPDVEVAQPRPRPFPPEPNNYIQEYERKKKEWLNLPDGELRNALKREWYRKYIGNIGNADEN